MTEEQEEQAFRVTDKRGFKEDGEARGQDNSVKGEEKRAVIRPCPQERPLQTRNLHPCLQ